MSDITTHASGSTPAAGHGTSSGHPDAPAKLGHSPVADVPHRPRVTDTDPKAARRAERQVSFMFMLAVLLFIAFVAAYVLIDPRATVYIPVFGVVEAMNVALGACLGAGVFLIGAAAIQWAKKLMPDVEVVQQRHGMPSDTAATAEAAANYERGRDESGFARFKMIRRTMIAALALFPIPIIVLLRDLWSTPPGSPSPGQILSTTPWRDGLRIVPDTGDTTGQGVEGIRPEDVPVGGLVSALPIDIMEVQEAEHNLNARGKAAIILVRMEPEEIRSQQGDGWDYQGILAYSKICTHVGCPIALYEHRTHHLLCPCHQSTFDLADAGNVVFGPAARRMPQLPIGVDEAGFLIAKSDFHEPIGPSFWERA